MKKNLKEIKISSQSVYSGKLLKVFQDRVTLPDNNESVREYIQHPGAVALIAYLPDGNILLERQFRYPLGQEFIEIPAGKIDPGETAEETGHRELLEETGYSAGKLEKLFTFHPCIGYSNEVIHIYEASELVFEGESPDENEFVDVFSIPFEEACNMVSSGEITDGKSMLGILLAKQRRDRIL